MDNELTWLAEEAAAAAAALSSIDSLRPDYPRASAGEAPPWPAAVPGPAPDPNESGRSVRRKTGIGEVAAGGAKSRHGIRRRAGS